MKRRVLLAAFLFVTALTIQASDIYYYQSQFATCVDEFKMGLKDNAGFEKILKSLDILQNGLASEKAIAKKDPLLSDIKAVYNFVGEVSPNPKSFGLTLDEKKKALKILDVTETLYNDSVFCLPITQIKLWDDTYSCFMVDNKSDSMMIVYKIKFTVQRKFSSYSGFVDAGVSKKSSRGIFKSFSVSSVKFEKEKCDAQLQVTKYIQPEVVQPKEEKYPEPDYLSPQQKQALKMKEKEQLKKNKEKEKKQALKDKEQKKKEQTKERLEAKKEEMKAREQKAKDLAEEKKEKANAHSSSSKKTTTKTSAKDKAKTNTKATSSKKTTSKTAASKSATAKSDTTTVKKSQR